MVLSSRFEDALVFATCLHANQQRKGRNVPYVSHLLAVTSLVLEYGGTEDEAIAALLHDAVEDQGGLPVLEQIKQKYGENVAQIVMSCTDSVSADPAQKQLWQTRKEVYLAHLPTQSTSIRLVSAADKLHNARSILADYHTIGEKVWDLFKGGKIGTLWYYRSLRAVFEQTDPQNGLMQELSRVVAQIEQLAAERTN